MGNTTSNGQLPYHTTLPFTNVSSSPPSCPAPVLRKNVYPDDIEGNPSRYRILLIGDEDTGKSILCNQLFGHPWDYKQDFIGQDNNLKPKVLREFQFFIFGIVYIIIHDASKGNVDTIIPANYRSTWDEIERCFEHAAPTMWKDNILEWLYSMVRFNTTAFHPDHQPEQRHWELIKLIWSLPQVREKWAKRTNLNTRADNLSFECNYFHYFMNFIDDFANGSVLMETNLINYYTFSTTALQLTIDPQVFTSDELYTYIRAINHEEALLHKKNGQINTNNGKINYNLHNQNTTPHEYYNMYHNGNYYNSGHGDTITTIPYQHRFDNNVKIELYAGGGATKCRQKWLIASDDADEVIYFISLAAFDRKVDKDKKSQNHHTMLDYSLSYFHSMTTTRFLSNNYGCVTGKAPSYSVKRGTNKSVPFSSLPQHRRDSLLYGPKFTLVFTHLDVLIEKIKNGVRFSDYCSSFHGDDNDVDQVKDFIIFLYKSAYGLTPPSTIQNSFSQFVFAAASNTQTTTTTTTTATTTTTTTQLTPGKSRPTIDVILLNPLDRDDCIEKMAHFFVKRS